MLLGASSRPRLPQEPRILYKSCKPHDFGQLCQRNPYLKEQTILMSNPVAEASYEQDKPFQTHWDSLKIASPRRRASASALMARDVDIDDIDMEMPPSRRTRESSQGSDGFVDHLASEEVRPGSNTRAIQVIDL